MSSFSNYIAEDIPVLVEFFATWCPNCQRMQPRIEELRERMGKRLKIVQLDIDSPANQEAIKYFRIDSFPTFILFKHEKPVWRDTGERTVDELIGVIDEYIRG